jgi:uncharacterized membrane protein
LVTIDIKGGGFMLKFTIIIILGIILAVISAKFIIKNFLVNYKGSESGFKNVCDILLIVISLLCSFISIWGGFSARATLITLQNPSALSEEMIQMLNKSIVEGTQAVIITIIFGYVCFILAYLLFKTIENEIQRELDRPKRKWNLDLINKK